jgi:tetratricopeptide (TPR) repeat protein
MNGIISERSRWQAMLQQKKRANAERWLEQIEQSAAELSSLLADDYSNLLKSLEGILGDDGNFDLTYQILDALSLTVFNQADWERWLVYLDQAVMVANRLERYPEYFRLLELSAGFARFTGDFEQAIGKYEAAIDGFRGLGDPVGKARAMVKLASLLDRQDRSVQATCLCHDALGLVRDMAGGDRVVVDAHSTLAGIHAHARDWQAALLESEAAYHGYQSLGIESSALRILIDRVAYYGRLEQWAEAQSAAGEVLCRMAEAGNIEGQIELKNNLGIIAYQQGDYGKAEGLWQEALRLQSQTQEPISLLNLQNNLGKAYTQLGEWETAEQMLQQATMSAKRFGDDYHWGNGLDNLADLYEAKGDWVACRQVLQEGIEGLEKAAAEKEHCRRLRTTMMERLAKLPNA